jgi:hypothetical protein
VVHNYNFESQPNLEQLNIDTGSAGISIINQIIKTLKKLPGIKLLEIDI